MENRRWRREWEPILARAYGEKYVGDPSLSAPFETVDWCRNGAEMVRNYDKQGNHDGWRTLTGGQKRLIREQLEKLRCSLQDGDVAWEIHERLRPNQFLGLTEIARLLDIGFEFRRLALGTRPTGPLPGVRGREAFEADLRRAYPEKP